MYLLTIYFHGPRTTWLQRVCAEETVLSEPVPFLWLARLRASGLMKHLVNVRYVITDETGDVVEPKEAPEVANWPKRSTIHGWPKHLG